MTYNLAISDILKETSEKEDIVQYSADLFLSFSPFYSADHIL